MMNKKKLVFIFNSRFGLSMQTALDFFREKKLFEISILDDQGTYFNKYLAEKIGVTLFTERDLGFSKAINDADFIFCSFMQEFQIVFETLKTKKPQIINIWHGFPIRNFGMGNKIEREILEEIKKQPMSKFITIHHIVISEFYEKVFENGFFGLKNKFWKLGNIRYQAIVNENVNARFLVKNLFHNRDIKHVIMYTPTHSLGNGGEVSIWPDYDSKRFNDFLVRNKIIFLIKQHDGKSVIVSGESNIIELDTSQLLAAGIYTQHLFFYIDLLILDSSSLVIDYFLVDKPIIFNKAPSEYLDRVGGYISKVFFNAGHIIKNQDQAEKSILEALASDPFSKKRSLVTSKIYSDNFSNPLENIFDLISNNSSLDGLNDFDLKKGNGEKIISRMRKLFRFK